YIYVLDGKGEYEVNGKKHILTKGMGIYFPLNATHSTLNLLDKELVDICISVPQKYYFQSGNQDTFSDLNRAVLALKEEISMDYLNFPLAVFDERGNLIYGNYLYHEKMDDEPYIIHFRKDPAVKEVERVEEKDVVFYSLRIGNDSFHGEVRVGYFEKRRNHEIDQIFKGSIDSMKEILNDIVKSIESYFSYSKLNRELSLLTGEVSLQEEELKKARKDILEKKENLLNSKVSSIFLINALNVLAYEASKVDSNLYKMVVHLSRLVSNISNKDREMETVGMQVDFVREYIHFQQKRYVRDFSYQIKVDPLLYHCSLPGNILAPLVENSFEHGFSGYRGNKILEIRIQRKGRDMVIEILNNGNLLDLNSLKRLNDHLKEDHYSTVSLIYYKLKKHYENFKYSYRMESNYLNAQLVIGDYFA
ncbi:MAG: cupin domain-containing protein, partial [Tissierellia bacterium]|nr:cupin domain-containing protein [Tissierellia bacterium]